MGDERDEFSKIEEMYEFIYRTAFVHQDEGNTDIREGETSHKKRSPRESYVCNKYEIAKLRDM